MNPAQINLASFNIGLAAPEAALLALVCVIMVAHLFWAKEKQEGRLMMSAMVTLAITTGLVIYAAMPAATSSVIAASNAAPIQYAFTTMCVVDAMATCLINASTLTCITSVNGFG